MDLMRIVIKCQSAFWKIKELRRSVKGQVKAHTQGFIPILDTEIDRPKDKLAVACKLSGGLGDCIVEKKIVEILALYNIAWIDVYVDNVIFGKAIFDEGENLRVFPAPKYYISLKKYDLAIMVEHYIHIQAYHAHRLARIEPDLYMKVKAIEKNWNDWYVKLPEQWYRETVHFQQCRINGYDRYTEMEMQGIFKICDNKVSIPLRESGYKRFLQLNLGKERYISVNYGADSMWSDGFQIKVWPFEYYNEFIEKFKKAFLDLKVVQVGAGNAPMMNQADFHVLGESLDTVKYVLKNSLLHIDCEGGLVHLATQLGTKCMVCFGPTPEHMYAYAQNINLRCKTCSPCMGLHKDWAFSCYRKLQKPVCMYGLTPDYILEKTKEYFNSME